MGETLHDKGYKRLFSNKRIFQQLIETFVDEEWVKDCDFADCQKIDKSFISAHYKETESDIIYQVKFKNTNAYIYLLLEFQSTVAWNMALRMLNYVSNFYMDYIETNTKTRQLPPVFPLVLYNGDDTWTAATDFRALLEQPTLLKQYAPELHYFKIAENEYTNAQLLKISNLVSTLFLAEKSHDIELIKNQLIALFENETDKQAISILLNWFKQLSLRGKQPYIENQALKHLYRSKEEVKTMLETNLERYGQSFFVKGKAEGRVEGKTEGKVEGKVEGRVEGKVETLILLLEQHFGKLTDHQKTMMGQFSENKLNLIVKKLFSIKSLDDIFTIEQ